MPVTRVLSSAEPPRLRLASASWSKFHPLSTQRATLAVVKLRVIIRWYDSAPCLVEFGIISGVYRQWGISMSQAMAHPSATSPATLSSHRAAVHVPRHLPQQRREEYGRLRKLRCRRRLSGKTSTRNAAVAPVMLAMSCSEFRAGKSVVRSTCDVRVWESDHCPVAQ